MDVLYYVGYEKNMTREFIGYVEDCRQAFSRLSCSAMEEIRSGSLIRTHPERVRWHLSRMRFGSGHEIITLPSVARALRGKQAPRDPGRGGVHG